jgi:hypothetical protein
MSANPAIDAFVLSIQPEKVWGEVLIQASGTEFLLRHLADRDRSIRDLRTITLRDVRSLAMFTAAGGFRPLRAAPNLAREWVLICNGPQELWRALQECYPGSIPDWFAAQNGTAPTNYREFTGRQSGMYRITVFLHDVQAANVTRAACHPRFCLKKRLWTVPGAAPDSPSVKSGIPCLEPCAVLLELARKATRIEQEEKLSVQLSRSELESFLAAVEIAAEQGISAGKIGDVAAPANARRLQLLLEKFKDEFRRTDNVATETET